MLLQLPRRSRLTSARAPTTAHVRTAARPQPGSSPRTTVPVRTASRFRIASRFQRATQPRTASQPRLASRFRPAFRFQPGDRARREAAPGRRWADSAERNWLARSRRWIAAQVALAMTALIVLVGGCSYLVLVHGQRQELSRELDFAAAQGQPGMRLGCITVYLLTGDRLSEPTGGPAGLPLRPVLDAVRADGRPRQSRLTADGTVFVIRTRMRGTQVVQVAYDDRYQAADRHQLMLGLALAETLGLLLAVGAAAVIGRRTIAPLAEALARQRRFVADASHELRTPIAQVHTRAQLIARQARSGALPADHQAELVRLIATTRQLGEIVDDLLLSSQLVNTPPELRSIDLAELTAAAIAAESPRAQTRGIALELHRPASPLAVNGVESALRRVVTSLLDNAIGHTPPGGRITVHLRLNQPAGVVELTVSDTGVGFDPADAGRLFDRFHRGGNGTGRRFGLGLALVREVVLSHHGSIEATGRPGQGARFTVRLPLGP